MHLIRPPFFRPPGGGMMGTVAARPAPVVRQAALARASGVHEMNKKRLGNGLLACVGGVLLLSTVTAARGQSSPPDAGSWYKGNTHTHSWFSDGDSPPELVVTWYKEHGYHFLVMTDHNQVDDEPKWVISKRTTPEIKKHYETAFGPSWVEKRERDGDTEYRLKPLREMQKRFDEDGKFLLITGNEISDSVGKKPVHLCGVNVVEAFRPPSGKTVTEAICGNIDLVLKQQKAAGRPMLVHVNHPNFGWGLTAEDMLPVKEMKFFEVHNGHGSVRNYGDDLHVSTERMWDILLTKRLAEMKLPIVYGVATDDAHSFKPGGTAPPGRGWVQVRAKSLTAADLIAAMERGAFYASTGVTLDRVSFRDGTIEIDIQARPGVSYRTQFIGTLAGYDKTVIPRKDGKGEPVTGRYSDDVGKVLSEQTGPQPRYRLTGREIYVRAKVISSARHPNPHEAGDFEVAWTQPVAGQ